MKTTQEAELRAMFENDFNQASNPIPQAEYDYDAAKARLEAMLNNGQQLDPPLTLSQGQALAPENTPGPPSPGDKVGALDGQREQKQDDLYKLNDQQSHKALADEIDAFEASGQPIPQAEHVPLTREEIQVLMAEEMRLLKTPELVYNPPPPTLGPGYVQDIDDARRDRIASLQRLLGEPSQAPTLEPADKLRADFEAAAAPPQSQGPEIEPE